MIGMVIALFATADPAPARTFDLPADSAPIITADPRMPAPSYYRSCRDALNCSYDILQRAFDGSARRHEYDANLRRPTRSVVIQIQLGTSGMLSGGVPEEASFQIAQGVRRCRDNGEAHTSFLNVTFDCRFEAFEGVRYRDTFTLGICVDDSLAEVQTIDAWGRLHSYMLPSDMNCERWDDQLAYEARAFHYVFGTPWVLWGNSR